mgnify:FL=1
MTDIINHPAHYTGVTAEIECIDIARHLNFQLGNAFKYIWRAGKKGGRGKEIEDLKKALWYLEDSIQNGYNDLDQCDNLASGLASIVTRGDDSVRGDILRDITTYRIATAANNLREMIRDGEASK